MIQLSNPWILLLLDSVRHISQQAAKSCQVRVSRIDIIWMKQLTGYPWILLLLDSVRHISQQAAKSCQVRVSGIDIIWMKQLTGPSPSSCQTLGY